MGQAHAHSKTNVLALEACATRAGFALGCAYSSSDEYEAEVIKSRRAAGAYGGASYHREFAMIATTLAVLVLLYLAH